MKGRMRHLFSYFESKREGFFFFSPLGVFSRKKPKILFLSPQLQMDTRVRIWQENTDSRK